MLMGIDVGTTHCKVGVFGEDGTLIANASFPTPLQSETFYDPEAVWQVIRRSIQLVTRNLDPRSIQAVGVSSMAETGLFVDRATGLPRTPLIPWHNKNANLAALQQAADPVERFALSGIRANYKCSLAKILWLKEQDASLLKKSIWLSTADYIVYRLTGVFVTDYSLAGRTLAYRIQEKRWDVAWLQALGLPPDLFPEAHPAGTLFPSTSDMLEPGTPVCVAGHDHVCAALAAGVIEPGLVLDSMGTAETLVGAWQAQPLGEREYQSGLLFGCHVLPDQYYWMGSLSSSGGAIEWLRGLINSLAYEEIELALTQLDQPTGILYFPYLSSSSSDPWAKAAFIGLEQSHQAGHLFKAAIEGTAYEIEHLRQMLKSFLAIEIQHMIAVGGGTRSAAWMQVKADVSNCDYRIFPVAEATLLGAAMTAGLGSGLYASPEAALALVGQMPMRTVSPQVENHRRYRRLFEEGYLKLMHPLHEFYTRQL